MFTGLVEDIGVVEAAVRSPDSSLLTIRPSTMPVGELALGDSVAIDGVCLTVTEQGQGCFRVVAGTETLGRTTLGDLAVGSEVHLERAMRLGDRLGGHLVQGHVDDVGHIQQSEPSGDDHRVRIAAPPELLRYVVEKGSICVDGISLTVASVDDISFAVALIPHTVAVTLLAKKMLGARVNLEADMIGKYVERLLGPHLAASS